MKFSGSSCPCLPAIIFVVLISSLSLNALHADDWPQWLGPKRDGSTTEKIKPWTEADPPKVLWRASLGNGYSALVIADGRVFIHTRNKDAAKEEEEVAAYDAESGKVLWSDSYPRPRFNSVLGTGPRATPVVAGKRLFTLGINGLLTCYGVEQGNRIWQIDLYDHFKADLPAFAVCSSPLVIGNRVIVSVGGQGRCVVALNVDTGAVEWQALDDAASTSSPVLFVAGGRPRGAAPDVVFVTPLRLVGLDPLDGSLRWEHPMIFQAQGTSPTPIAIENLMVTSTQSHGAVAVQVKPEGEASIASAAWQNREAKSYFSSGVPAGDLALLVINTVEVLPSASITCVEVKTGKPLWTKANAGYFHVGLIRMGDGKIVVLSDAGTLSLLEVDAQQAKELASAKVCGGTLVNPAFARGRLYVRDGSELVCLAIPQP